MELKPYHPMGPSNLDFHLSLLELKSSGQMMLEGATPYRFSKALPHIGT